MLGIPGMYLQVIVCSLPKCTLFFYSGFKMRAQKTWWLILSLWRFFDANLLQKVHDYAPLSLLPAAYMAWTEPTPRMARYARKLLQRWAAWIPKFEGIICFCGAGDGTIGTRNQDKRMHWSALIFRHFCGDSCALVDIRKRRLTHEKVHPALPRDLVTTHLPGL